MSPTSTDTEFFLFVDGVGLFDCRFDALPEIPIRRPSLLSPSAVPILNCGKFSCDFSGLLSWTQ